MISWKKIKQAYLQVAKGNAKRIDVEGAIVYAAGKKVRIDVDPPVEPDTTEEGEG